MTAAMIEVSRNCISNQPRLRNVPAIQATAVTAYGAAVEARSPMGLAAIFCHASTAGSPTTGRLPSHSGGGGTANDRTAPAHSTISPALATTVPVASDSGTTRISSQTASHRGHGQVAGGPRATPAAAASPATSRRRSSRPRWSRRGRAAESRPSTRSTRRCTERRGWRVAGLDTIRTRRSTDASSALRTRSSSAAAAPPARA